MKAILLTGAALQAALETTEREIQCRDCDNNFVRMLEIDEAISLMLSGMCEAYGRRRRIRFLRAVAPSTVIWRRAAEQQRLSLGLPWRNCWRTGKAAVLPPSVTWVTAMYPDRGDFVRPAA